MSLTPLTVKEKILFIYALGIFWPRIHSSAENFVDNLLSKEKFWPKFCQMFVDEMSDVRLVSLGLSISSQRFRVIFKIFRKVWQVTFSKASNKKKYKIRRRKLSLALNFGYSVPVWILKNPRIDINNPLLTASMVQFSPTDS